MYCDMREPLISVRMCSRSAVLSGDKEAMIGSRETNLKKTKNEIDILTSVSERLTHSGM